MRLTAAATLAALRFWGAVSYTAGGPTAAECAAGMSELWHDPEYRHLAIGLLPLCKILGANGTTAQCKTGSDCLGLTPLCNTDTANCTSSHSACMGQDGTTWDPEARMLPYGDPCKTYFPDAEPKCCSDNGGLERLFETFDRQFGQCDSCKDQLKLLECSLSCDSMNSRFFSHASVDREALDWPIPQLICPYMCENLYKSCKDIKW